MNLNPSEIEAIDASLAISSEHPSKNGFQSLSFEEQSAVLKWIQEHCQQGDNVNYTMTSNHLARHCSLALKESGFDQQVDNLAMKTAMKICGFDATVKPVEFHHYRFKYQKEP